MPVTFLSNASSLQANNNVHSILGSNFVFASFLCIRECSVRIIKMLSLRFSYLLVGVEVEHMDVMQNEKVCELSNGHRTVCQTHP